MQLVIGGCPENAVEAIISQLIEKNLASCVNVIPNVQSTFKSKGQIVLESEALLLIQTPLENLDNLFDVVDNLRPSKISPLIALMITSGHYPYLKWAEEELTKKSN